MRKHDYYTLAMAGMLLASLLTMAACSRASPGPASVSSPTAAFVIATPTPVREGAPAVPATIVAVEAPTATRGAPPTRLPGPAPTSQTGTWVRLVAPPDQSTVWLGQPVEVRAAVSDTVGIAKMELWVNDMQVMTEFTSLATTELTHSFSWMPRAMGRSTLRVRVYNTKDEYNESAPVALYVESHSVAMTRAAVQLGIPTITPTSVLCTCTPTPTPAATVRH
jgi:hypothetical protein